MKEMSIYLASPLAGHKLSDEIDWRNRFTSKMNTINPDIGCLSPIYSLESKARDHNQEVGKADDKLITTRADIIFHRDISLINRSTMIFVNFEKKWESIGACFEIGYSYCARKPIVIMTPKSSFAHDHPFLTVPCIVTDNWDDAYAACADVLQG